MFTYYTGGYAQDDWRVNSKFTINYGVRLEHETGLAEQNNNFTVGFDKTDAAKISMKGPDEDNIVWIGHKYGSRLEAETVAATIESRLKSDAA